MPILKGVFRSLEFKNYDYSNITISGNLKNKTYNGSVNIKDPNVELEFLGNVNLSDSIAAFDFTANVTDANLYALHLDQIGSRFYSLILPDCQGNRKFHQHT